MPVGKREAVLDALDDQRVDYVVTDETSDRDVAAVVSFPLPVNAVEPVLESLRAAGLSEDAYTVVIDAETVLSRHFEELSDEYAEAENGDRIAREELQARASDLAPTLPTYATMTVVSSVIAAAGLLLDSPATVVGSMVIAPLLGPAMAASVGTVVDDREQFSRGVRLQLLGLALAVGSAAVFTFVLRYANVVPPGLDLLSLAEVRERLRPDVLSLIVALGAGVAGAVSLMTGVSSALVGVAIAVALIPPAATVGIGLAWGLPSLALGSSVLVLVNVLSINLAALLVLWYAGYRPKQFFRVDEARSALLKRTAVLLAGILVLSVFLGGVTYSSYQTATAEQSIRTGVEDVLADEAYEDVTLLDVEFEYSRQLLFRTPATVVVTLGVPPDSEQPGLSRRLDERVDESAGRDVTIELRYLTVERVS